MPTQWIRALLRCAGCAVPKLTIAAHLFQLSAPSLEAAAVREPPPHRIDVWRGDEGLPQSSVTSIVQTRDGYLWLGTFGGLVRFDGVRFKVFDPNNTPGLPSGRVVMLFEDREGVLWIGTEEGHLVKRTGGRFEARVLPHRETLVRYAKVVAGTGDGALWLGTAEGLLIRRRDEDFTVIATNWNSQGTTMSGAGGIVSDAAGQLWGGAEKALVVWREGGLVTAWGQAQEAGFNVDALAASRAGGCWVAGNGRLRRFDGGKWIADAGPYAWRTGVPNCLHEDRHGQLWVGTYGGGLYCYRTNGTVLHLTKTEGLPGNLIRSLCEDREGNLWVGTEGSGLARIKQTTFRSLGQREGLSGDCVLSMCEGQDGEIWIATNGNGVDRLQDGSITRYGAAQGLTNECVWTVFQDRGKTLWAGTWGSGLFKLENGRFVPFTGTGADIVCGIYEDSRSRLWLGQQMTEPAITFLHENKPARMKLPSGASHVNARVMAEDRAGNVWLGTHDDGLYRIGAGEVVRFGVRDGLGSERIRSLYADDDGVLWIGTAFGGLNRFADGRFTAFTTREGLADDTVLHIAEDRHGNLWCSADTGVFRVSKGELNRFAGGQRDPVRCFAYTQADGLPSLECTGGSQPTGCRSRDGRLWFPTVNGVAIADPDQVPFNPLPPPIMIEEVAFQGKGRAAMKPLVLPQNHEPATRLAIPPGVQRLEFHYTALSFTAPEKVRFKYRLDGLEDDWVDAGPGRTAVYGYLRPGDYDFRVLACNNDGVWSDTDTSLAVTVLPHYWQTWWFRLLAATGVVLLFVAAYEIRLASERRVGRMRLRIARDLHDEVGANLGSIALISEVMSRQPNGKAEEISEIRRVAMQTIDSLRDIVWFLDPAADNMGDLILRMKDTARTMLQGIAFEFQSSGELDSAKPRLELRRNVFPMFKEILHNITQHARASRVTILVEVSARQFRLRVGDNGVGFEPLAARGGNGLKNLRRRAADLAGTVEIQSRPGAGTTVTITAPIPRTREIRA